MTGTAWVYAQSEPGLFTVGHYTPAGDWLPESDHPASGVAAERVHWLNGGDQSSAASDLAAAEDMIGVAEAYLRQAVERVHAAHAREPIEACHNEWCAEGLRAVADVAGYCRPSCERDR